MPEPDSSLTCIHAAEGLCPACREEYETDPDAWYTYGYHPEGIARWNELVAELDAAAVERAECAQRQGTRWTDAEIPF